MSVGKERKLLRVDYLRSLKRSRLLGFVSLLYVCIFMGPLELLLIAHFNQKDITN